MRLRCIPELPRKDRRPAAHTDPAVTAHQARVGLEQPAKPEAGHPALGLAANFDDLANIERLQDQHRDELNRRQQLLLADQQTCDALETYLQQRLDQLLHVSVLLERVAVQQPAS